MKVLHACRNKLNLFSVVLCYVAGATKKGHRGPTFKLAGVPVNAKSVMLARAELEPLCEVMPATKDERKRSVDK